MSSEPTEVSPTAEITEQTSREGLSRRRRIRRLVETGQDLFEWAFSTDHADGRMRRRVTAVLTAYEKCRHIIDPPFEEKREAERIAASHKHRRYMRERRNSDPEFRILLTLRCRLTMALRQQSAAKGCKTVKMLGCTIPELKVHLEKQFKPGMTWQNHGKKGWHIDHIRPCASFDLTDYSQQLQCFHFSNLQPMWACDNHRKGGSWNGRRSHRIMNDGKMVRIVGGQELASPDSRFARTDYKAIWESGKEV